VVTHQLQVERRTGKVHRPETDVLPLCHATNSSKVPGYLSTVCPLNTVRKTELLALPKLARGLRLRRPCFPRDRGATLHARPVAFVAAPTTTTSAATAGTQLHSTGGIRHVHRGRRPRRAGTGVRIFASPRHPATSVAKLMNKSDHDLFCKLCAPTHALNHLLPLCQFENSRTFIPAAGIFY